MPSISFKNSLCKCKSVKDRIKSVLSESNIFFSFFLKGIRFFSQALYKCTSSNFLLKGKFCKAGMRGGEGKEKKGKEKVDDTGINTRSIIDDLVGRRGRAEWRPGISFTISQRSSRKDISGPCYSSPPPERGNNRGRNGSSNFIPTETEHLVDRKTPRGQSHVQDLSDCKYARSINTRE